MFLCGGITYISVQTMKTTIKQIKAAVKFIYKEGKSMIHVFFLHVRLT